MITSIISLQIKSVEFTEDGTLLTGCNERHLKYWDLRKMTNFASMVHDAPIHSIVSAISGAVVTDSRSGVAFWDLSAQDTLCEGKKNTTSAYSKNGRTLITFPRHLDAPISVYTGYSRFSRVKSAKSANC